MERDPVGVVGGARGSLRSQKQNGILEGCGHWARVCIEK